MSNACKKNTAIVTGASRGIGRSIAITLGAAGYNIVVNYSRSESEALSVCEEITACGGSAISFCADVSNETEVVAMTNFAIENFGGIDLLVNNAGVSRVGLLQDMTSDEWRSLMAVNLDGAFHCCKAALPQMISQKRGCIINISSMWGQVGASCEVAYSASKAGLIGLTKALAKEVGPSGIRVNCIAPGMIMTGMNSGFSTDDIEAIRLDTPLETLGTAEDVASAVVFLSSEGAKFVTGQVIGINGGLVI